MTPQILILLTVAVAASAFPSSIYDFKTDYMDIQQKGTPGKSVEGEYSWVAPNGREIMVKYIADKRGFRVIDSKNNFNDWDFDRSSSSSAGDEENYSVQEVSHFKVPQRKAAAAPRAEKLKSFPPAAPVAAPVVAPRAAPVVAPRAAPVASLRAAPRAVPVAVPKSSSVAAPVEARAAKAVSKVELKAEEKKEPASASPAEAVKKSADSTAAAEVKGPVEIEETTAGAMKEAEAAPAEAEEGAEEGGEGAEAEEEGEGGEGGEEAEMEEEAEAEEMEEV